MPDETRQVSVLLIEDHRDIAESIVDFLEPRGFVVDYAADGITGMHLAVTHGYDVIVLDVMLPGADGFVVCRKLREEARRDTPILMLTARDTLEDKITGLEAGADDYLVKPFEIRELEARLRTLVRRHRGRHRARDLPRRRPDARPCDTAGDACRTCARGHADRLPAADRPDARVAARREPA